MQRPEIVVFTVATLSVSLADTEAAVTTGDNALAGAKLCAALRLGDDPVGFEPQLEKEPAPPAELYKINMSLAPEEWRRQFAPRINGETKEPAQRPKALIPQDWAEKWDLWARAEMALQTEQEENRLRKDLGLEALSKSELSLLRPEIATIANKAYEIYKEYAENKGNKPDTDTELKAQLQRAIYGNKTTYDDDEEGRNLYGGEKGGYSAVCQNDGNQRDPTLTLAATYACVCGIADTHRTAEPCSLGKTKEDPKWKSDGIVTKQTWEKMRWACPQIKQGKLGSDRLEAAVTAALGTITLKDTTAYIGNFGDGTCDGKDGNSCVKINDAVSNNKLLPEKIKWLKQLITIADKLKQRSQYNNKTTTANQQLNQLHKLTESRLRHGHLFTPEKQQQTHEATKPGTTFQVQGQCEAIQTAKLCKEKEPKCEWKGKSETEGECKPKDDDGQPKPAEGQGETANSETKKCSNNKTEKDCKDGCKWEDNSCKDSSIIVTKTFALSVVSAAFAALIF